MTILFRRTAVLALLLAAVAVSLLDSHNLVLHGSVRYQAGVSYTLKAKNGIAIAAAGPANRCDAQMNAIQAACAARQ